MPAKKANATQKEDAEELNEPTISTRTRQRLVLVASLCAGVMAVLLAQFGVANQAAWTGRVFASLLLLFTGGISGVTAHIQIRHGVTPRPFRKSLTKVDLRYVTKDEFPLRFYATTLVFSVIALVSFAMIPVVMIFGIQWNQS